MHTIDFEEFLKVDLRVGTIIKAEKFEQAAKPAYKIWADFGLNIGIKKSSAQITHKYTLQQLQGMQIIGVVNLRPKQIGNFMSEFLVTGFDNGSGQIILAQPQQLTPNGAKLI